ncbi:MAG TPA: hypothetical protein PK926_03180 [Spirochaetota bacterium]|nr:hypothetical protein [Spirochaetota bacterium]HPI91173.1 hypothetical protein [Spirochaetota bacterium]HPR47185.1 hypothetical protein [Spirochaetota bacterium]
MPGSCIAHFFMGPLLVIVPPVAALTPLDGENHLDFMAAAFK